MIGYVLVSNEEKNVRLDKKKKLTGIFTVERLCIFEDIVV